MSSSPPDTDSQPLANLSRLTEVTADTVVERYVGFQAGGGGMVERPAVEPRDATFRVVDGQLVLRLESPDARFDVIQEAVGLPVDWQSFGTLRLSVAALSADATVELTAVGARCLLSTHQSIPADGGVVELNLRDLPLTAGMRAAYRPSAIRIAAVRADGATDQPVDMTIDRLELIERQGAPEPVVDRFGQRMSTDWPGKVTDEVELKTHAQREGEQLAAEPLPGDRDAYGGWTAGPRFEASGFFRTEHDGQRWWLVTPEGHPFWSIGTTGIRLTDTTTPDDREQLYEFLPPREGHPLSDAWYSKVDPPHKPGISFYHMNVLRKYDSVDAWRDRVIDRFRHWGLNTAASWCGPMFIGREAQGPLGIVYTVFFRSRADDGQCPMLHGQFADVFDPAWEPWLEQRIAEATEPHRDDPWLLGYFVDNESSWGNPRFFNAPAEAVARKAWVEYLESQKVDLATVNEAFGTTFGSLAEAAHLQQEQVPKEGRGRELVAGFTALYAERYFSTIARLLRQHDPNHLYLGCRFVRRMPDERIVAACGRYVDVLSVNCYDFYPRPEQFGPWSEAAGGKPIVLGEHHFPMASERQLPPLYPAFTPAQRREMYVNFVRKWAEQPYAVGNHWFQHADQPLTGRGHDGENQTVGIVDITDQPHDHMIDAIRESTAHVYDWHATAGK